MIWMLFVILLIIIIGIIAVICMLLDDEVDGKNINDVIKKL